MKPLILLFFPLALAAQKNYPLLIDNYLKARTNVLGFSGSVLVASHGKVIFKKAYGLADKEWNVPNTIDTRFAIGSMTKQLTAGCIMLLQEKGKLSVNDKLSKYFPDYPKADSVTIHMLLNHTSGMHDLSSDSDFLDKYAFDTRSIETLFTAQKKLGYDFSPGTDWAYCNAGYFLLGLIIEKTSGMSYEQFLQQNILDPLGMTNTKVDYRDSIVAKRAHGYYRDNNSVVNSRHFSPYTTYSAGEMLSTVEDMYKWATALKTEKLLSAASKKQMMTAYKGKYGYGFFVDSLMQHPQVAHGGGDFAFLSNLAMYPQDDLNIIIMTNTGYSDPWTTTNAVALMMFGRDIELPYIHNPITLDPSLLDKFTGTYEAGTLTIQVIKKDDKLYRHREGTEDISMTPESLHKFFYDDGSDRQIDFLADRSGKIVKVRLVESGMGVGLKRVN
ncbi:MAG: serine hydrolase domain-containing protein [Chitinophagaceae bacterium]